MANQELVSYIKQVRAAGTSDVLIRKVLMDNAWKEIDIDDAFIALNSGDSGSKIENQSVESVSSEVTPTADSSSKKKSLLIIAAATLGVLILAGGAFAYVSYTNSDPIKIFNKSINALPGIESMDYSFEFKITLPSRYLGIEDEFNQLRGLIYGFIGSAVANAEVPTADVIVTMKGTADGKDPKNPRASIILDVSAGGMGGQIEARLFGESFYLKLNELRNISPEQIGVADLSQLENVWVKVEKKDLAQMANSYAGLPNSSNSEEIAKTQKIIAAIEANNPLIPQGKADKEKVNGVNTYHSVFKIDRDKLMNLIKEISKITYPEYANVQGYDKDLAEGMNLITFDDIESWIGKSDSRVYRFKSGTTFEDGDMLTVSKVTANFSNYNKVAAIEEPKDFKTLEEFTAVALATAQTKSRDAKRAAELSQLRIALEIYYDDHGYYPTRLSDAKLMTYFNRGTIPVDPVTGEAYLYAYSPSNKPQKMQIYAELESDSAPYLANDNDINSSNWFGAKINASDPSTESCAGAYSSTRRTCVLDYGIK